jgi:hypothetical protein
MTFTYSSVLLGETKSKEAETGIPRMTLGSGFSALGDNAGCANFGNDAEHEEDSWKSLSSECAPPGFNSTK